MKNLKLKLNIKSCIVACSGGPDSMALLDLVNKSGIPCVVCHVNYQKRETAFRDEKIVEEYCRENDLRFYVIHPVYEKGNFQAWARDVRYAFFKEIMIKEKCEAILVAHHEDDVLETYIMQKKRNSNSELFGISEETTINECKVLRPLLSYSKQDLLNYVNKNNIKYGLDETNLEDHYSRNRVRHKIVSKMDESDRNAMIQQIKQLNKELNEKKKQFSKICQEKIQVESIINNQDPEAFLMFWVKKYSNIQLTSKQSKELVKQLHSTQNVEISLSNYVKLSKMYNSLELIEEIDVSYCYVLDKIEVFETPYFKIATSGKSTEAVTLSDEDFPITIRNFKESDAIQLRFGTKKVSRWFIDRKIKRELRKSWPIVLNSNQEIILVPQLGCDCKHFSNNPTCFVVK